MARALKPSLLTCAGIYDSSTRKVPWFSEFSSVQLQLLLLLLRGKIIATGSTGMNLTGTWPFYGSLLIPALNLSQN